MYYILFACLINLSWQETLTLNDGKISVSFTNCGTKTNFVITATIENNVNITNAWLGLGLNLNSDMNGANVVVCKKTSKIAAIEHYYNQNLSPVYMDPLDKFIGLGSMSVSANVNESVMTCKFTRDNSNPNMKYFNLNKEKLYILVAYGSLNGSNLMKHQLVKETKLTVNFAVDSICKEYTTLNNDKMIVNFKNYGTKTEFEVKSLIENNISLNNVWLAFGLNLNRKMQNASVVMCKIADGNQSVEQYFNDGLKPVLMDSSNKYLGLSSTSISVDGSVVTCKFTRDNFNSNPRYLNLNTQNLYVLIAYGSIENGTLNSHITSGTVKETKNVIGFPIEYSNKAYTLTWIDYSDSLFFVFSSNLSYLNNFWTSFGLSTDNKMGNDDVIVCKVSGNKISVERYYNDAPTDPSLLLASDPTVGLSEIGTSYKNGILTCSFSRLKHMPNVPNYFNSSSEYYILNADGELELPSGKLIHHTNTAKSLSLINFAISKPSINRANNITINGEYKSGDFNLVWKDSGDYTDFVFQTNVSASSNLWSSFAFSTDAAMGNDDVCLCKVINGNNMVVERYYNIDKSRPNLLVQNNPSIGLSNINITLNNGLLTCTFKRLKSIPSVANYFDLKNKYYVLFAKGSINDAGIIQYHNIKTSSPTAIDFQTNSVITTTVAYVTQNKPQTPFTSSGAFKSGSSSLEWSDSTYFTKFKFSDKVNFKKKRDISLPGASDQYIAFGFSKDQKMGDDGVVVCKISNQLGTVEQYYNNGKTPQLLVPENPTIGITNADIKIENGQLICSFQREKSMTGVPNYFDLSNQYYLLIAKGSVSSGNIQFHEEKFAKSDTQINFNSNGTFTGAGSSGKIAKVKAHGCLMVFAWMFCVSTGILFARYYKFIFPSIKILDVAFWFNVHRLLMFFTPICSIVSFIVILSAADWKWVEKEEKLEFAHSIFGIVAIGLSFFQVIIAFFRPDKEAPRRPLFNFFHRLNGISCFAFAIIAIFLAVFFEKMYLGNVGWGIVLGWTLWVLFLPLIIEFFSAFLFKSKSETYQVNDNGKMDMTTDDDSNKGINILKQILLVFHLIIALGFTIALIVVIGMDKNENTFPV